MRVERQELTHTVDGTDATIKLPSMRSKNVSIQVIATGLDASLTSLDYVQGNDEDASNWVSPPNLSQIAPVTNDSSDYQQETEQLADHLGATLVHGSATAGTLKFILRGKPNGG